MLNLVGMGLGGARGLSIEALDVLRNSDTVILDTYTSLPPEGGFSELLEELGRILGKRIQPASRHALEDFAPDLVSRARRENVSVLILGDPLVATTHSSLLVLAAREGIRVRVVHAASVFPAAAVRIGLHAYKLAPPITLPYGVGEESLKGVCERITKFLDLGLHITLLLEQSPSEGRVVTPKDASLILTGCRGLGGRLAIAILRFGSWREKFIPFKIGDKAPSEIPSLIVLPSELHFSEEEALEALVGIRLG